MPLLIGYNSAGLDGTIRGVLDEIVASIQTWAGQVDGINAAERLQELSGAVAGISTIQPGMILEWTDDDLPSGYLWCDGAAVSRTTYANLFNRIGVRYGSGDNATTFNVPDRRGRFGLGKAASGTGATLGETGGAIDHTHTGPSHTHSLSGSTATESAHTHNIDAGASGTDAPNVDYVTVDRNLDGATRSVPEITHTHTIYGATAAGSAHSHGVGTLATGSAGTGATSSANPAYIALNYVIKT